MNNANQNSNYSFFALISRMKYINRWSLMKNNSYESLSEHSLEVAVIAHALSLIKNTYFGGNIDADKVALFAIFHDAHEILTGDLPTPVKYSNKELLSAYKNVENEATLKLLSLLPIELQPSYKELLDTSSKDTNMLKIIKAADKFSALIKCIQERNSGNTEFLSAEKSTLEIIKNYNLPECNYFLENFIPYYNNSLDELQ